MKKGKLILITGPQGSGKTLIARALAREFAENSRIGASTALFDDISPRDPTLIGRIGYALEREAYVIITTIPEIAAKLQLERLEPWQVITVGGGPFAHPSTRLRPVRVFNRTRVPNFPASSPRTVHPAQHVYTQPGKYRQTHKQAILAEELCAAHRFAAPKCDRGTRLLGLIDCMPVTSLARQS